MRLIDAKKLREQFIALYSNRECLTEKDSVLVECVDLIDNAPTERMPIKCKDCKHQKKWWNEDKRMKEKGYWIYGCDLIDDHFVGTPVWGEDNQFCSSAERKEVANEVHSDF